MYCHVTLELIISWCLCSELHKACRHKVEANKVIQEILSLFTYHVQALEVDDAAVMGTWWMKIVTASLKLSAYF